MVTNWCLYLTSKDEVTKKVWENCKKDCFFVYSRRHPLSASEARRQTQGFSVLPEHLLDVYGFQLHAASVVDPSAFSQPSTCGKLKETNFGSKYNQINHLSWNFKFSEITDRNTLH